MAKKSKLKPEISEKEENINADKNNIFNPGGELVVDVFETNSDFVVFAAIAGVSIKDLDISVEKEMMVIKGQRQDPHLDHVRQYFYQECYFGPLKRNPHSLYKKMRNLSIYNFLWTGYRRASGSVAFISALNSIAISKCLISYASIRGATNSSRRRWRWGGWWRINDIICNANNRKS